MKKNAFTLVELIATIALLGMLATITITISVRKINETKERARDTMIESIELAAKNYINDYGNEILEFNNNDNIYITLQTLVEKEYFTESLIDPTTKKSLPLTNEIYVTREESGEITSTYNVNQRSVPKLTLIGSYNEYVEEGSDYVEKGVTALSPSKEDISSSVTITGTVDTSIPNTYKITYELDNEKITRNVIVFSKNISSEEYYKFIVNLDGGTDNTEYEKKYKIGSMITLEEPTKEGYDFIGWNIQGKGSNISGNILTTGPGIVKITALWEEKIYGVGYIENLFKSESTLHNGLIKDDTENQNIRYAGADTNIKNRVYFNCKETDGTNKYASENYDYKNSCEIWRIIGVFETKLNETDNTGIKKIKIVREEGLVPNLWDTTMYGINCVNQWGETTLTSDNITLYDGAGIKTYLNKTYYNSLSNIAKEQISNTLWHTGAVADDTASGVYEAERSNTVSTGKNVNYTTTWLGKIGLIYPSDFGYAGVKCGDYTINDFDADDSCGKTNNWLTASFSYWTISPDVSDGTNAWYIDTNGNVNKEWVASAKNVRPALYLLPNIKIKSGNGSSASPYILEM